MATFISGVPGNFGFPTRSPAIAVDPAVTLGNRQR